MGLALIGEIGARRGVVILDAVRAGAEPGTIHVLPALSGAHIHSTTAHEGNARELMATAALLGDSPEQLAVVGVEPDRLDTGIGLSACVERAVNLAAQRAAEAVETMLVS
jgi:hydrogenase maturation protease